MKKLTLTRDMLVTGENALDYLAEVKCKKAVIITGGQSMKRTGILAKVTRILEEKDAEVAIYSGVGKNPTTNMVLEGVEYVKEQNPDCILAVGGGSAIDAAKVMLIFYEHPEMNFDNIFDVNLDELCFTTKFIAIPSTSGTASEVTKVSVITYEEERFKKVIKTIHIFPNIAILDPLLPATLPAQIAAETGMDALTHAMEAYINKSGNDFTDVLAKGAIEGIIEWLPESVIERSLGAREKVHNYQCMAGMAFANSGLGMVHGVSHAFGGMYNVAHGLANAVILPYSMDYNKKDPEVLRKYAKLSHILGMDVIEKVKKLSAEIAIPAKMQDAGVAEEDFKKDFDKLLEHSMKGSTVVNPIPVSREDMEKFLNCIYYGKKVDF